MKKFISLALVLTLIITMMVPALAQGNTANVLKDGTQFVAVETYPSNSSANKGYKISSNKTMNNIVTDGEVVGSFYFDENAKTVDITITKDVAVDVEWHCSKYYARATLDGTGVYSLPQLMQDNGKYQGFDQIWIVNTQKASVVVSYERYTAYVEIWNDIYLEYADLKPILSASGGLAHYYALLEHYEADTLPPYFQFDASMKAVYDYWADELEPGLMKACEILSIDLYSYVVNHSSNNTVAGA